MAVWYKEDVMQQDEVNVEERADADTCQDDVMRGLERQNEKLRQMYVDLMLENQMLKDMLRTSC